MITEVTGTISHRILLNYRIEPEVAARVLPAGLEPKLVNGVAIGGICQVSLSGMRPKGLPGVLGMSSHNAAHRIAVSSQDGEGVYVPRRDTNALANVLSGGRLFPGVYHRAKFDVQIQGDHYRVGINDEEKNPLMRIEGEIADSLSPGSTFGSVEEVSQFFEGGNMGWSSREGDEGLDAIELQTESWNMKPMAMEEQYSSFFSDENLFPAGTVEFDCAMIMRNIKHSWVSHGLAFSKIGRQGGVET